MFMLHGNCGLPQLVRVSYLIASVGVEIPEDILWTSKMVFGRLVMKKKSKLLFMGPTCF